MEDKHLMLLGEIKGKLESIEKKQDGFGAKLDAVDGRLHKVETKASVNGGVMGTISGIITGFVIAIAKGPGGPGVS